MRREHHGSGSASSISTKYARFTRSNLGAYSRTPRSSFGSIPPRQLSTPIQLRIDLSASAVDPDPASDRRLRVRCRPRSSFGSTSARQEQTPILLRIDVFASSGAGDPNVDRPLRLVASAISRVCLGFIAAFCRRTRASRNAPHEHEQGSAAEAAAEVAKLEAEIQSGT